MESGKLRFTLYIEQRSSSVNTYGDRSDTWVPFLTVRGDLRPISGRELFAAQQYESEVQAKAFIRYKPGITTKMRLRHDGLYYNIVFVQHVGNRKREIVLFLSEGLRD